MGIISNIACTLTIRLLPMNPCSESLCSGIFFFFQIHRNLVHLNLVIASAKSQEPISAKVVIYGQIHLRLVESTGCITSLTSV